MSDNMFDTFDLGEAFYWVCSYDLNFAPDSEKRESCVLTLKSKLDVAGDTLHIIKSGTSYMVGQFLDYEYDAETNTYCGDLRHPSLIIQEHDLPRNMAIDHNFLGPLTFINMLRVVKLLQAKLSSDQEMIDDTHGCLHQWYTEHTEKTVIAPEATIIPFRRKIA